MVSQETASELWFEWVWIFGASVVVYTIIYRLAFEKQLSHSSALTIFNTVSSHSNHTKDAISPIDENKSLDDTENPKQSKKEPKQEVYTPENCMKYSSCILSIINCILCSFAGLSIFYHRYWIDPIYGTPGIPFYISATCQAYFLVDLGGDIIIYFWYNLKSFRFDVLIHHCFALTVIPWMAIPIPKYAWFMICVAFSFEISTIFLNATFFCKWYDKPESVTIKYKLGFLISWFLVRVPGTIGLVVWAIIFRERIYNEYPLEKFIGVIVLSAFNLLMQGLWTILIIRKTYRTLTANPDNEDNAATNGFDLKRRNSLEVTNVTSQA